MDSSENNVKVQPTTTKYAIQVSAPGKIILHGEHSVVYGKLAVAASLGLRTTMKLAFIHNNVSNDIPLFTIQFQKPTSDKCHFKIKEIAEQLLCHKSIEPEELNHIAHLESCQKFVATKCVDEHLQPQLIAILYVLGGVGIRFPLARNDSYILDIGTNLTIGAGTGSSASYAVCLSALFLRFHQWLNATDVREPLDKELISKWAYNVERIFHGRPSGIDNTVCTYGGLVAYRKNKNNSNGTDAPTVTSLVHQWRILLINSLVSRNTKQQVEVMAKFREKHIFAVDAILEAMEHIATEALQCLMAMEAGERQQNSDDAIYAQLCELFRLNHGLLRCLNVSHAKLEEACTILEHYGLNGKMTGAGGGGYVICLVPPSDSATKLAQFQKSNLDKTLAHLNRTGFEAVLTNLGGCGVTIE